MVKNRFCYFIFWLLLLPGSLPFFGFSDGTVDTGKSQAETFLAVLTNGGIKLGSRQKAN